MSPERGPAAAGMLLGIALVIYVVTVVRELRGQSVL